MIGPDGSIIWKHTPVQSGMYTIVAKHQVGDFSELSNFHLGIF